MVFFFKQLMELLQRQVSHATLDTQSMEAASHYSSVHGVLLTMRYCVDATNWRRILKDAATLAGGEGSGGDGGVAFAGKLRELLADMLALLRKVSEMTLWAIGDKTQYGPGAGCNGPADSSARAGFADVIEGQDGKTILAPKEQMLVVGAWLSCKEMSGLIGSIANGVPFPRQQHHANVDDNVEVELLSAEQVAAMGRLLLDTLLTTRHSGAIEKTFLAFQGLCKNVLASPVPGNARIETVGKCQSCMVSK